MLGATFGVDPQGVPKTFGPRLLFKVTLTRSKVAKNVGVANGLLSLARVAFKNVMYDMIASDTHLPLLEIFWRKQTFQSSLQRQDAAEKFKKLSFTMARRALLA